MNPAYIPLPGKRVLQSYIKMSLAALLASFGAPSETYAYIDPGITGMFSQLLYVLFYGALGVLLFSVRYLKQFKGRLVAQLSKCLRLNKPQSTGQKTEPESRL